MAVGKNRASQTRTRRRRTINGKIVLPNILECNNCGAFYISHRVCKKCGYYKGKEVFAPKRANI